MNLIEEHTQISILLANPDISDSLKHELRKELAELEARKAEASLASVSVYPRLERPLNTSLGKTLTVSEGAWSARIWDKNGRTVVYTYTLNPDKEKFERHLELLVILLESGIGIEEETGIYHA